MNKPRNVIARSGTFRGLGSLGRLNYGSLRRSMRSMLSPAQLFNRQQSVLQDQLVEDTVDAQDGQERQEETNGQRNYLRYLFIMLRTVVPQFIIFLTAIALVSLGSLKIYHSIQLLSALNSIKKCGQGFYNEILQKCERNI